MKVLVYTIVGSFLACLSPHMHAEEPDGHERSLWVPNGVGSGHYWPGDEVAVSAVIKEDFHFVKWTWSKKPQSGSTTGWLEDLYYPETSFTMPNHNVKLLPITARLESWFPVIDNDESIQDFFLLPRTTDGQPVQRFPHRLRVTLEPGDQIDVHKLPEYFEIRLGWFPTEEAESV